MLERHVINICKCVVFCVIQYICVLGMHTYMYILRYYDRDMNKIFFFCFYRIYLKGEISEMKSNNEEFTGKKCSLL